MSSTTSSSSSSSSLFVGEGLKGPWHEVWHHYRSLALCSMLQCDVAANTAATCGRSLADPASALPAAAAGHVLLDRLCAAACYHAMSVDHPAAALPLQGKVSDDSALCFVNPGHPHL
jgi:hypothetical protein